MVELVITLDGVQFWYLGDDRHRANGPAIVRVNGTVAWYWYDQPVTEFEHMMLVAQEIVNG